VQQDEKCVSDRRGIPEEEEESEDIVKPVRYSLSFTEQWRYSLPENTHSALCLSFFYSFDKLLLLIFPETQRYRRPY
jgi:hypothetical protein